MSHAINDRWLEEAKMNFEDAVIAGDYGLARLIVRDLVMQGFHAQAAVLERELVQMQNEEKAYA